MTRLSSRRRPPRRRRSILWLVRPAILALMCLVAWRVLGRIRSGCFCRLRVRLPAASTGWAVKLASISEPTQRLRQSSSLAGDVVPRPGHRKGDGVSDDWSNRISTVNHSRSRGAGWAFCGPLGLTSGIKAVLPTLVGGGAGERCRAFLPDHPLVGRILGFMFGAHTASTVVNAPPEQSPTRRGLGSPTTEAGRAFERQGIAPTTSVEDATSAGRPPQNAAAKLGPGATPQRNRCCSAGRYQPVEKRLAAERDRQMEHIPPTSPR